MPSCSSFISRFCPGFLFRPCWCTSAVEKKWSISTENKRSDRKLSAVQSKWNPPRLYSLDWWLSTNDKIVLRPLWTVMLPADDKSMVRRFLFCGGTGKCDVIPSVKRNKTGVFCFVVVPDVSNAKCRQSNGTRQMNELELVAKSKQPSKRRKLRTWKKRQANWSVDCLSFFFGLTCFYWCSREYRWVTLVSSASGRLFVRMPRFLGLHATGPTTPALS
jgi:hypothetical protein